MSRGYPSSDRQVSDLRPPMTTNESAPDPMAGERDTRCPGCGHSDCPRPRGWSSLECDYDPPTPDADDASTYCGAEFGEVRAGECECPKCASDHPDPLQDWPLPGHLKSDASEPLTEAERASIYATVRGYDEDQHPGPIYAAIEHIKAAAATKARADERERIAQAIEALPSVTERAPDGWVSRSGAARIARGVG